MLPLLLLIPGGILLWVFAERHAERRLRGRDHAGYLPRSRTRSHRDIRPEHVTASDYLRHLHEATMAARVLDTVKPAALAGDVRALTSAPDDVRIALEILSSYLPVLFAQKDLNVLGASPPLPEDGVIGPATAAAISAIQTRFGETATGDLDDATAVAIRYSVGCINAQGF
jgi:hypothetical protein